METVPPVTEMSTRAKFVEELLSVKVIVAVSPALSEVLLLAIVIVGASLTSVTVTAKGFVAVSVPSLTWTTTA